MIGVIKEYNEEVRQGRGGIRLTINGTLSNPDDFISSNVNDEELVIDNTHTIWDRLLFGVPGAFIAVFLTVGLPELFFYYCLGNFFLNLFMQLFFVGLTVTAWIFTAYFIINPRRKLVFNRLNGTVTLPAYKRRWWSRKTVTQPFKGTRFTYGLAGLRPPTYAYYVGILGTTHTFAFFHTGPFCKITAGSFSALVWYMDKNRPLPPNKILDPYREKDYNRRKAEGFPEPLFYSSIDTPEWEGADEERKMQLEKLRKEKAKKEWKPTPKGLYKKKKKGRK